MRHGTVFREVCPAIPKDHVLQCSGLRLNVVSSEASKRKAEGFARAFASAWRGHTWNVSQGVAATARTTADVDFRLRAGRLHPDSIDRCDDVRNRDPQGTLFGGRIDLVPVRRCGP